MIKAIKSNVSQWVKSPHDHNDEYPTIAGLRGMERRAVNEGWGIGKGSKDEISEMMIAIATGKKKGTNKDKIGGANTVIKMIDQDQQEAEKRDNANNINIGGSVVIGTDALSSAIRNRMARRAAAQCTEGSNEGSGLLATPVDPEDWGDDGSSRPAA